MGIVIFVSQRPPSKAFLFSSPTFLAFVAMLKRDLLADNDFKVIRFKIPTSRQRQKDQQPDIPYYEDIAIDKHRGPDLNQISGEWEINAMYYDYDEVYGESLEQAMKCREERHYCSAA